MKLPWQSLNVEFSKMQMFFQQSEAIQLLRIQASNKNYCGEQHISPAV